MARVLLISVELIILLTIHAGCAKVKQMGGNTGWHRRFGWNAEEYFDDPNVIALCKAIEANDIEQIDRLVADGADVNALGEGKMTPLLWAYPDNKLERFKRLLEHGADPNIVFESDFGTRGAIMPGDSVTHMACMTSFPGYFEAVFQNGGDPNLLKETEALGKDDSPLFSVIIGSATNKGQKVQVLIDKGASLNHMNGAWSTPTMQAVSWGGQYDLALLLLNAGADHRVYVPKSNSRLVHLVIREERRRPTWTPQQAVDYQQLLKRLDEHGESTQVARDDLKRWNSWSRSTGEYRRKMDAEIAARKAREAGKK